MEFKLEAGANLTAPRYELQTQFSVDLRIPLYHLSNSNFRPLPKSDLHNMSVAQTRHFDFYEPSVMDVPALALGCKKFTHPNFVLNPSALCLIATKLANMMRPLWGVNPQRLLTPYEDAVKLVDQTKSPGYGWTERSKGDVLIQHPGKLEAMVRTLLDGEGTSISVGTLKSELREREKVREGKTRVFMYQTIQHYLACAMLFDVQCSRMNKFANQVESVVTIGVQLPGPPFTASVLTIWGHFPIRIKGDVKGCDTRLILCIAQMIMRVRASFLPHEFLAGICHLYGLVYAGFVAILDKIYRCFHNKSGWFLTGHDNSFYVWAMLVYGHWLVAGSVDYEDHLIFKVNGDDFIASCNDRNLWVAMTERLLAIGFEVEWEFVTEIENFTYLSHTLQLRYTRRFGEFYCAAGNLPKLLSSLNWYKWRGDSSLSQSESQLAHLLGIRICLFPWPCYFEMVTDLIGEFLEHTDKTNTTNSLLCCFLSEDEIAQLHLRFEGHSFDMSKVLLLMSGLEPNPGPIRRVLNGLSTALLNGLSLFFMPRLYTKLAANNAKSTGGQEERALSYDKSVIEAANRRVKDYLVRKAKEQFVPGRTPVQAAADLARQVISYANPLSVGRKLWQATTRPRKQVTTSFVHGALQPVRGNMPKGKGKGKKALVRNRARNVRGGLPKGATTVAPAAYGNVMKTGHAQSGKGNGGIWTSPFQRERVANQACASSFTATTYYLNPGLNPSTSSNGKGPFSWIAGMAPNFTQYRFKHLKFIYEMSSGATMGGNIRSCFIVDPTVTLPTDANSLEASGGLRSACWEPYEHICKTDSRWRTVRATTNSASDDKDLRLYDAGVFMIACDGCSATDVSDAKIAGEWYVEYIVEFRNPMLTAAIGSSALSYWVATSPTKANPLGSSAVVASARASAPAITSITNSAANTLRVYFNPGDANVFTVIMYSVGTVINVTPFPAATAGSGCTVTNIGSTTDIDTLATATLWHKVIVSNVSGDGSDPGTCYVSFSFANCTTLTALTVMVFSVSQLSSAIASPDCPPALIEQYRARFRPALRPVLEITLPDEEGVLPSEADEEDGVENVDRHVTVPAVVESTPGNSRTPAKRR